MPNVSWTQKTWNGSFANGVFCDCDCFFTWFLEFLTPTKCTCPELKPTKYTSTQIHQGASITCSHLSVSQFLVVYETGHHHLRKSTMSPSTPYKTSTTSARTSGGRKLQGRKNLYAKKDFVLIECMQGDQPVRCPNRFFPESDCEGFFWEKHGHQRLSNKFCHQRLPMLQCHQRLHNLECHSRLVT